jgi:hypothetical protein
MFDRRRLFGGLLAGLVSPLASRKAAAAPCPEWDQTTPVFERRTRDGRVMAVYANGRSDGFPEEYSITINRVPSYGHHQAKTLAPHFYGRRTDKT